MKKLISCLLVSAMMATAFASCGDTSEGGADTTQNDNAAVVENDESAEDTAEEAEETEEETEAEEEETEAEEEADADEEEEDTPIAVAAEDEFEDAVVAESGDAILAIVDGEWYVQYWGTNEDYLTYDAGVAHINGDGEYTVSVTADTNGLRYDVTGDPAGDYTPSGLEFLAVKVFDGTTLYPDMSIEITSVKVDGEELELTAKNYTSSDDGEEMRANIYNHFVSSLPDDAHDADGAVTDDTEYSWQIVDPAAFADGWTTVEVTFNVKGAGEPVEAEEEDVIAEEDADVESDETESADAEEAAE